jgi:hypothetical protein
MPVRVAPSKRKLSLRRTSSIQAMPIQGANWRACQTPTGTPVVEQLGEHPMSYTLTAIDAGCDCCSYMAIGEWDTELEMLAEYPNAYKNRNYEVEQENDDE